MASCPVCGTAAPVWTEWRAGVLHRCPACDLRFRADLGPEWSGGYAGIDERYLRRNEHQLLGRERQRILEAQRRVAWVRRHRAGGDLLEVGCAAGEFLGAASAAGFAVRGIEASPELSARARERWGVEVDQGLAERELEQRRRYDAICMWHVLEHVTSPSELLSVARSALAADGVLFIEVPNIGSVGARALGERWPQLGFADHSSFFTARALEEALRRSGLVPIEITTVLAWEYLSARERLTPRRIAGRLHRAALGRTLRGRHPTNGDLLRAVARRATD